MGWRDDFIFILIMRTGNTSEIGLVFLMYGLALFSLRKVLSCLGPFFVGYVFTFSSIACRSNRLSAGMGRRADYHYSYTRPATHRRLAWFFLMSDSPFVFVLGVRARPWWGLPQSVAVGVICPHLIFPELKCHSDL